MVPIRIFLRDAVGQSVDSGDNDYEYRHSARTWDIVTQAVCLSASSLCIGMRIYTKVLVLRTPGWEDLTCFLAWLGLIAFSVITIEADKHGNGVHQDTVAPADLREYGRLANASQIIYAPLMFITKLSIFLLYLRVFAPTRRGKTFVCIHLLIWFNLAFYLANFFLKIFQCIPRAKIWDKTTEGHCININIPILVTAAINVVSDLLMLTLPIVCVWRLQMSIRRKLGVSAIFAAGIFGCFASIMRLHVSVKNRHTDDQTFDWYSEILWSTAEITCGILASCLPALPTFFRHFFTKARTIFSEKSRTRGSSQHSNVQSHYRSWEKPATETYAMSQSRGRKNHDLYTTERSIHDNARDLEDDRAHIFTGPCYATSEAKAEGCNSGPGFRRENSGSSRDEKTTPLNTPKNRISRSKGKASRRTAFVRDIAREVVGLAPYERRVIELLRNAQDKRARKLAKKRLGTFTRGKRKVEDMQRVIAEARRVGAH
ncbi:ribosomal protein L36e-domain-containing protein [Aspergillus unguis]